MIKLAGFPAASTFQLLGRKQERGETSPRPTSLLTTPVSVYS